MDLCITVDLEHDCPPFLTTYRGVTEGMPRLLDLLAREQAPATFFCTGDVARKHPEIVRRLVAEG
ncbi:MAG TPA: polysaccharide deacetylase family protein, partial [Polyangiaceae bacterium]|nr:polysaccharide deacetylase family protein [Polyangiaceae bacterium]